VNAVAIDASGQCCYGLSGVCAVKFGQWVGLFCLIIALLILWQFRQTLLLVFAAVVVATALNRIVQRLQKSGVRRGVAVLLTLSIVSVVVTLFVLLIVPPFIDQFIQLAKLVPSGAVQVINQGELLLDRLPSWVPKPPIPTFNNLQSVEPLIRNVTNNLLSFFGGSLTAIVSSLTVPLQILFVLVLAIMMLSNPQGYRGVFLLLFPSFYRRRADSIVERCEGDLGNWLAGIVISSSCIAALSGIGLWVLGIQLVLAQALLAGLLNFIPNIGPSLSVIFPITVALLDAPWKAIAVLALYIVIQQLESYWITPTIMANQVSLLPALTLVAQIFFASFFGFLGLLLALPLAVVARAWIEEALIVDVLNQWEQRGNRPSTDSVASSATSSVLILGTTSTLPSTVSEDPVDTDATKQ
jgi:predicted PurR-regulated permease PerM